MRALLGVTVLLAAAAGCAGSKLEGGRAPAMVEIQTSLGTIEVEVQRTAAPVTAENFLRYVRGGFYDGGRFHRTVTPDNQPGQSVKIEVVQAGVNPAREKEEFAPIPLERTSVTGLRHVDGKPEVKASAEKDCLWDVRLYVADDTMPPPRKR